MHCRSSASTKPGRPNHQREVCRALAASSSSQDDAVGSPASQASAVSEEPRESAASGNEASSPTHSSEAEAPSAPIAADPHLLLEENNRLKRRISELEKDNSEHETLNGELMTKLQRIKGLADIHATD